MNKISVLCKSDNSLKMYVKIVLALESDKSYVFVKINHFLESANIDFFKNEWVNE